MYIKSKHNKKKFEGKISILLEGYLPLPRTPTYAFVFWVFLA